MRVFMRVQNLTLTVRRETERRTGKS